MFVNGHTYHTYGNRFSKEMKAAITKLRIGDTLYFEKVKTKDRSNPDMVRLISNEKIEVIADN